MNLEKRRLLGVEDSKRSVFCGCYDETATHFFLHCEIIDQVWRELMKWLNFNFISPPNVFIHALCWSREARGKKLRQGAWLI